MPKLKFYDLKGRKSFETDKFKVVVKTTKKGVKMKFAVADAPSGIKAHRIMGKA